MHASEDREGGDVRLLEDEEEHIPREAAAGSDELHKESGEARISREEKIEAA